MGKYPFIVVVNKILAETDSLYLESTRLERHRKFRRIHDILQELREAGTVSTTSPKFMAEQDVLQFVGWCKAHLDNSTSAKYLRYLREVLQASGNSSALLAQPKYRRLLPRPTQKPVHTVAADRVEKLMSHDWSLEDPFLDSLAKAAIALYLHTGLRSGELRNARLCDLSMDRMEITVSHPKGLGSWVSGNEVSPIMPGAESCVSAYLEARKDFLQSHGLDPETTEQLFPYMKKDGGVAFYEQRVWSKLKSYVVRASGVAFKWKDLRPTFAQKAKDKEVPIEAVSKALRHSSTVTTERYYARIRPETAFSLMRQAWEAPVLTTSRLRIRF